MTPIRLLAAAAALALPFSLPFASAEARTVHHRVHAATHAAHVSPATYRVSSRHANRARMRTAQLGTSYARHHRHLTRGS